jgi:hypothetical protein
VLEIANEQVLEQTAKIESEYKGAVSAPLFFDKFVKKTFNFLYSGNEGYPREIRIPKSIDHMLAGDFEPGRILRIEEPLMLNGEIPIWRQDSTKEIYIRGLGYINGDSRYPSQIVFDDTTIHMILGGVTGHGKSVTLNSIILAIALEYGPWDVKFIMSDAKIVEFKKYADVVLPHISAIAATSDSEYMISVLQDSYEEMQKLNAVFGKVGCNDIVGFRKKTGLTIPRTVIIFDEVQAGLSNAGKKSNQMLKLFDDTARLGRNTGYHLLLCSQETGDIPANTLNNIQIRAALGCFDAVSTKILGNNEATINYKKKGRLIVNTNSIAGSKKDNIHFRVPFIPDNQFQEFKKYLNQMGAEVSFAHPLSYYDQDSIPTEEEYKEIMKSKSSRTDIIYLGEPSFVMRDPDNMVKMEFNGQDIENVLVFCSTIAGIERYAKMLKFNAERMGDKAINNVMTADPALSEKIGLNELTKNYYEVREFDHGHLQNIMNNVYLRRLIFESEDITFSAMERTEASDKIFYEVFAKGSEFDTELNKCRARSILGLLSSEFYASALGIKNITSSEEALKVKMSQMKKAIEFCMAMGFKNEKLTRGRVRPIFNWVVSIDRIIGLGRDSKMGKIEKFAKVLQDSYAANVRWICTSRDMSELTSLKSGWRYLIMEGLTHAKARHAGCEDYPEVVAPTLGVFLDVNSESRESVKFKRIKLEGELM